MQSELGATNLSKSILKDQIIKVEKTRARYLSKVDELNVSLEGLRSDVQALEQLSLELGKAKK